MMSQGAASSKLIVGILFIALVILIATLIVMQRGSVGAGTSLPYAVAMLRRSVKAHEIGVYSGLYER